MGQALCLSAWTPLRLRHDDDAVAADANTARLRVLLLLRGMARTALDAARLVELCRAPSITGSIVVNSESFGGLAMAEDHIACRHRGGEGGAGERLPNCSAMSCQHLPADRIGQGRFLRLASPPLGA